MGKGFGELSRTKYKVSFLRLYTRAGKRGEHSPGILHSWIALARLIYSTGRTSVC